MLAAWVRSSNPRDPLDPLDLMDLMDPIVKRYSSGGITVIWKPALCQHGGICARGLPMVFDPRRRPWIQLEYVDPAAVTAQVDQCPSGALSWERDS